MSICTGWHVAGTDMVAVGSRCGCGRRAGESTSSVFIGSGRPKACKYAENSRNASDWAIAEMLATAIVRSIKTMFGHMTFFRIALKKAAD